MWIKRFIILILMLLVAGIVTAQSNAPRLAFVNDAGQLVVASADGQMRWIITNPGESLHPTFGFTLSPDGEQIAMAISSGDIVSLRIGHISSMAVKEVTQLSGTITGGVWTPDGDVIVSDGTMIARYSLDAVQVHISDAELSLISPYSDDRPYLDRGRSLSPDGSTLFYQQAGVYTLQSGSSSPLRLDLSNAPGLPSSGMWSDAALMVAYWGASSSGTTALAVTNATSGSSITLDSGSSAPVMPVAWEPGSTRLLYRDPTGLVRLADLACLNSGCADNPLQNGQPVIPATGTDLQFSAGRLIYRDGDRLQMLDLPCVAAGNCLESGQTLASSMVPDTLVHGAGAVAAYSISGESGASAVQIADLACQPDCSPRSIVAGGVAGLLSADGSYLIVQNFADGLQVLRLSDLAPITLYQPADPLAAGIWSRARWP